MDTATRLKIEEQKLIHGKGITVFELADKLNRSYNYLCRISSMTEELPFPVELAVPAMKIKKNYGLLKTMAWECGFALIKLPRAGKSRKEETQMAADYQKACSNAINAVIHFFEEPTEENHAKVEKSIIEATSEGLAVKKYADKKASKQLELPL
jgi:hypothetical protein